jgi:hypothetical protein
MKLSSIRIGFAFALLLVLAFASSRADFQWNQGQGPPNQVSDSACSQSAPCVPPSLCFNLDPPVSVVPNGGTNSVIVKSYQRATASPYGTCQGTSESDTCYAYPNVQCAVLIIYGAVECPLEFNWGQKTVYSGNCTP